MRIFLALEALVWLPYGLYCFVRPDALLATAGIATTIPTGMTELRAMYGGLQTAIGGLCLLALATPERVRAAVTVVGTLTAGLAGARTLGVLLDGGLSAYTVMALVFEWGSCLGAVLLMMGPGRSGGTAAVDDDRARSLPPPAMPPATPPSHHRPGQGNGFGALAAVFWKDLIMTRRDRGALFISLVVPVLMITVIAESLHRNKDEIKMRVPVVDEDQGPVSRTFIKLLSEHADVVETTRAEAEAMVRDQNKAAAAIVFPEHLSKGYLQGQTSRIRLLTDPARSADLEQVKVMLLLMDKRAAALADPLAEERLSLEETSLTSNRYAVTAFEQTVPGYSLMFTLLAVIFGTAMGLHDERAWGTLPRLLVSPGGFTWKVLGKLGVRFLTGVAQLLVLLVFGHFAFGLSLGPSPLALILMSAAILFPIVGLGMLSAGLASTREQTLPIGLFFVLAFSCLGGLWWPPWVTPLWMQKISSVIFTTWALHGLSDLMLRDRGLLALPQTTSVLIANGVALTALGLVLFRLRHSAR